MDFLSSVLSIIILDLVLAGDNAVVIALAARNLPPKCKNKAIYLGTLGAIVIRILMTLCAVWLLTIPYLQALGGLLLIPVAIKLLKKEDHAQNVESSAGFWSAIKTIIIADAVMGVDNVLAIAGAAHGNFLLVVIGLLVSVPIVVWGSKWIGRWMETYPILVYVGSGILAWTAGSMIVHDKIIGAQLSLISSSLSILIPLAIVCMVVTSGYVAARRRA